VNPNKKNIEIIKQFNLSPHPEGGWFREIVRSENSLIREDGQSRNFITGIYYLLERDSKSAWHRVKNADAESQISHPAGYLPSDHRQFPRKKQFQKIFFFVSTYKSLQRNLLNGRNALVAFLKMENLLAKRLSK